MPVTSLSSLSSLMTVGGSITILNIDSLSSLEGLGAVTSVGSIRIQNNNVGCSRVNDTWMYNLFVI